MRTKRYLLMITGLLLLAFSFCINFQEVKAERASCSSASELQAFLDADAGGTICLAGDITVDESNSIYGDVSRPITVEMGEYQINVAENARFTINGPVIFHGIGASVLNVRGGYVILSGGTEILSEGENAVALDISGTSDVPNNKPALCLCRIEATGENSVAIRSDQSVMTQMCRITGTKASIVAPQVTLDGSQASPLPEQTVVIERLPTLERILRLYGFTVIADADREEYEEIFSYYDNMYVDMIDPDSGGVYGFLRPAIWSGIPQWPVETGRYFITVEMSMPTWAPVEIPAFQIPLTVIDDSAPYITVDIGLPEFNSAVLRIVNFDAFTHGKDIVLYYSVDEGKTWRDCMKDLPGSYVDMESGNIAVEPMLPEREYLFYVEMTVDSKTVTSNILYYPNLIDDLGVDYSHGGGSSDEDDFKDQGEKPPAGEIIPAPEKQQDGTQRTQDMKETKETVTPNRNVEPEDNSAAAEITRRQQNDGMETGEERTDHEAEIQADGTQTQTGQDKTDHPSLPVMIVAGCIAAAGVFLLLLRRRRRKEAPDET